MAVGRTYSVTQLNQEIKGLLESNPSFRNLFVQGEISNFKAHSSGHLYLTLKDAESAISAVMFRTDAMRLRFQPQNGLKVIARGRVSSFPKSGQVQLYLSEMMPDGAGALHLAYEQLRDRLYREGLFDEAHKQPIPAFPHCIALVTSPTGAAVHDMLRILRRRWPMAEVLIYPALVQGREAPASLVRALQAVNRDKLADLIITGRGGGSLEDLWAFNDEAVARAIYASHIPVISAVGHEPDVTIADFVADLRAPTPSGAAELAVPAQEEVREACAVLTRRLEQAARQRLTHERLRVDGLCGRLGVQTPVRYLAEKRQQLVQTEERLKRLQTGMLAERRLTVDLQIQRMTRALQERLAAERARLGRGCAALDALSPLRVLGRGYAIASDEAGRAVTDSASLAPGSRLQLRFYKGSASCEVREIQKEN